MATFPFNHSMSALPIIPTMTPELLVALQRTCQANRSERLFNVCSTDLGLSGQWGFVAVNRAFEAWIHLEQLGADVMSMGRSFDFCDRDKLDKALKNVKVLLRNRVVWQTMGLFRTMTDTQVMMDYLTFKVDNSVPRHRRNDLTSQLKNAIYKAQSHVLLEVMSNPNSWARFSSTLCVKFYQDDEMQDVVHLLCEYFTLSLQHLYPSLMAVPHIVNAALDRSPAQAVPRNDCMDKLRNLLGFPDFLEPVFQLLNQSNEASLLQIQHSVAAWARVNNDVEGSGLLSRDDGKRKFRKLDTLLREEILCTCYAFLGKDALTDFALVAQLIREQCEAKRDMPWLNMEYLLRKLQTSHAELCPAAEFILSPNCWSRTLEVLRRTSD